MKADLSAQHPLKPLQQLSLDRGGDTSVAGGGAGGCLGQGLGREQRGVRDAGAGVTFQMPRCRGCTLISSGFKL